MSSTLPPSVISHVSLGTNDYPRAKAFYDAVLATLQIRCVMDFPGAAGYGRAFPEFWVQTPHDGGRAGIGRGPAPDRRRGVSPLPAGASYRSPAARCCRA